MKRPRKNSPTPDMRKAALAMWAHGHTQREIAASLGMNFNTTGGLLRAHGAKRNGKRRGCLAAQFDAFVLPEPNSGCWLWDGSMDTRGYGQIRVDGKRLRYASHVALELDGRPVPKGMCACHHCDNPACVNPSHLFVGTLSDNTQDMIRKGRASKPPSSAKLQHEDVRKIRARLATGESGTKIAREFGVSHSAVYGIKNGSAWREVA